MRRRIIAAAALAAALLAPPARAQVGTVKPTPGALPYSVELREVTGFSRPLPALHSFAWAQSDGEWLLLTGRRSGLHTIDNTLSNAFPTTGANDSIYVVNPAARQVWAASVRSLPDSLADALMVTNANACQDGDWLYLIGGYGHDSRTDSMVTFPTLTAVKVSSMIGVVKNGGRLDSTVWRTSDFTLKVAGGQLARLNGAFYLVMGQRFDGLYSASPGNWDKFVQVYTERIQVLGITPPPALGFTRVASIVQNPNEWARNFHRRDLNVVGALRPGDGRRLVVYGGVFVPGRDAAYQVPVYINPDNTTQVDSSFFQAMSQYDAASLLMYDRTSNAMYTTLFGGISLYHYDDNRSQLHVDTGLPFIDDVSVIAVAADGSTRQWVYPTPLPALLGTDARVFPNPAVSHDAELDVVYLDALPGTDPVTVGWLYGGIQSDVAQTTDQRAQTRATNRLFEVRVTRGGTAAIALPTSSAQE